MKHIELIIFDLDGTLINSLKDIALSLNFALNKIGLEEMDEIKVMGYIGSGVKKLLEDILGSADDNRIPKMFNFFREHHQKHLLDNTVLYSGVRETLQFYDSKKKAVISNKSREFSDIILKGLGIDKHFDIILGPEDVTRRKPSPDPILNVLSELNIKPQDALIVGDNPIDIQAGKAANILTCGATYGFCRKEELKKSNPNFLIDDISELKKLIF